MKKGFNFLFQVAVSAAILYCGFYLGFKFTEYEKQLRAVRLRGCAESGFSDPGGALRCDEFKDIMGKGRER